MPAFHSPQDVYARKLLSHRGYPLWTPEPNVGLPECYRREGLQLGDVGVVVPEDGSFDVFFNITFPPDHRLHEADGVPNNFTEVTLGLGDYRVIPDFECPGCAITPSAMQCTVSSTDLSHMDGEIHRLTDYQFSQDGEGAMLILPQGAELHRMTKMLLLLDIVVQNAVEWYRFARERLYRDISNDSLYLITGFHKAESWSLASFRNVPASSAKCKIMQLGKAGPILPDDCAWEAAHSLDWRVGPRRSDGRGIPNQAVFIVGFRISVNEELLHWKRVTVKVDHSNRTLASRVVGFGSTLATMLPWAMPEVVRPPESATRDEEADESSLGYNLPKDDDEYVSVENVPQILESFHPSDIINRYMLRKVPSAKIAVTHDSQWIDLLEGGMLEKHDMMHVERLEAAVSKGYNIVTKDGAVYLQSVDPICLPSKDAKALAALSYDDSGPSTSQHASNFNFQDFGKNDMVEFVRAALSKKLYECRWTMGAGADRRVCGSYVRGEDFAEHVCSCHGHDKLDKTRITCLWEDCSVELKSDSLIRHIQERHLEVRYPCPYCAQQFTRYHTFRLHVERQHGDNV